MNAKSIVILISGSGSNLQAIIDATLSNTVNATISAVISNRPDARGLAKAKASGINTHVIDHKAYNNRETFDTALLQCITELNPNIVVLAGFMRILNDEFIDTFNGRLINIHPSLLPAFKGLNTHQRVLEKKCDKHGASVHFVSSELDSGAVIIQAEVPVNDKDTEETLALRVLEQEHKIYPLAIQWLCEEKISLKNNTAYFKNEAIKQVGIWRNNTLSEPLC